MNTHASNPLEPADALPPELQAIGDALDRLGAQDRAAAGPAFEQRLAASTLPGLPLAEHVEALDALAGADRSAASSTLEDRIFVATRGLLNRPAAAPDNDEVAAPAPLRVEFRATRASKWGVRIAAMLALGAGVTLVYMGMRPPAPTPTTDSIPSVDRLARQLEDDFESLAAILSVSHTSETEAVSSSLENVDELEFPRLDLLNFDGEGSL